MPADWKITIYEPCGCQGAIDERAAWEANEQHIKDSALSREKAARIAALFEEMPERFKTRTFDTFLKGNANLQTAYDVALAYPFEGVKKGLLLSGPPGVGKTHLAAAVAIREISKEKSVVFGTVPTILARIKQTFGADTAEEADIMRSLTRCDLLVLDDLGKEKVSQWVEEKLYEIVNARYEANLPLIVTMNCGMSALQARYKMAGAAIVSRLWEMCRGVVLEGEDFRRSIGR